MLEDRAGPSSTSIYQNLPTTDIQPQEQPFPRDNLPGTLRGHIYVADTSGGPCRRPRSTWILHAGPHLKHTLRIHSVNPAQSVRKAAPLGATLS